MNAFPKSPKTGRAKKRTAKRFAQRLKTKASKKPAKTSSKKKEKKSGQKAHAASLRREAKAKSRSGTMLALDYCEEMHRIFMDQQNDPNPLRKFITVKELAARLHLGTATVNRHLDFMRDRLHLPVKGIHARGGQGYTEKVHAFPLHTLTEGDMFLFVIAKGALGKGTPFAEKFPPLCAKVEKALQSDEVDLKKLESIVHFHNEGHDARVQADPNLWDFLASACMDNREISFDHLKAEPGATPTHRVIKPLSLHEIGRAWYVWCPDDENPGEFKKFAIARMARVERTGEKFEPIAFNPVEYLKSIGAFTGGSREAVHLRILGKTALHVQERPLVEKQVVVPREDGSIDLYLNTACTPDLEDWITQRAGRVEVVAPLKLRQRVREVLLAGAELNA